MITKGNMDATAEDMAKALQLETKSRSRAAYRVAASRAAMGIAYLEHCLFNSISYLVSSEHFLFNSISAFANNQ